MTCLQGPIWTFIGPEVMRLIRHAMDVEVKTEDYALPTKLSKEYFQERFNINLQLEQVSGDTSGDVNDEEPKEDGGFCVLS